MCTHQYLSTQHQDAGQIYVHCAHTGQSILFKWWFSLPKDAFNSANNALALQRMHLSLIKYLPYLFCSKVISLTLLMTTTQEKTLTKLLNGTSHLMKTSLPTTPNLSRTKISYWSDTAEKCLHDLNSYWNLENHYLRVCTWKNIWKQIIFKIDLICLIYYFLNTEIFNFLLFVCFTWFHLVSQIISIPKSINELLNNQGSDRAENLGY